MYMIYTQNFETLYTQEASPAETQEKYVRVIHEYKARQAQLRGAASRSARE